MGYLLQSSSGLSDTYFASGSIWFRSVGGAANTPLLQILTPGLFSDNGGIDFGCNSGSGFQMNFAGDTYSSGNYASINSPNFAIAGDAWHHVSFAVDANHDVSYTANLVFDGSSKSMTTTAAPSPPDRRQIKLNGLDVGLPGLPVSPSYDAGGLGGGSLPICFGDYQFWVGQYIDWTNATNYAKIVNVSAGKGTPVDPAIAAAAFGQQTLLFKGNHTAFTNNLGTGGAFTLTGTDADFTPTPSYG
jgi:hypothetical protein